MTALSKLTLGRAGAPNGHSYVTLGMTPLSSPVPDTGEDLSGELGVCQVSEEAGSFLSLTGKGIWQLLAGASLVTKGVVKQAFQLANPDCIPGVILTENGPLTKGYGDAQLAGVEDVVVRVNGVERSVTHVDPILGVIVLTQAVEAGSEVEVDYYYTPNPCIPFNEWNSLGYTWNKFGNQNYYSGRFPYQVVFGPAPVTPQPLEYGYTYTAFDANISTGWNDPTSFLWNEPSHQLTIPRLEREIDPVSEAFEGDALPTTGGWTAEGSPPASPSFEEGLFLVEDLSSGSDVFTPEPLFYRRDQDLTFSKIVTVNFRLKVFSYTSDGDFTGIAAGFVDEDDLYMLGFLDVGGKLISGFLGSTGDETSWQSYKGLLGAVTPRTSGSSLINDRLVFDFEPGWFVGDEVFIEGNTYVVASIEPHDDDPSKFEVLFTSEIVTATDLAQAFRVFDYTSLSSYRLFRNESGEVSAYTGGNPSPYARSTTDVLASQEEVYDLLESNVFFFGSLSKQGVSKSGWDFFRYTVQPVFPTENASRIYVNGEFNDLPEADPVSPWMLLDDQGSVNIVADEYLSLEQAGRTDQGSLTYGRIEPLLTSKAKSEMEAYFRVDGFVTGSSPVTLTMADDRREVTLGLFASSPLAPGTDYATFHVTGGHLDVDPNALSTEGLITPTDPATSVYSYSTSYSGTQSFEDEGWGAGLSAIPKRFTDHHITLTKPDGVVGKATSNIVLPNPLTYFDNYVMATRVRVNSVTLDGFGRAPLVWGVDDTQNEVFISFLQDATVTRVIFVTRDGTILADVLGDPLGFDFDWNDGEFHAYRLIRSEDVITLFVDGTFLGSVTEGELQTSSASDFDVELGLFDEAITFDVDYVASYSTEYKTRQVGLYMGGDLYDPNSYERVDAEFLGTFLKIRVFRDPAGKTQVFLNDSSTPSFVKQYTELPKRTEPPQMNTSLGYVRFGALDPRALSESVWDYVRYNVQNQREKQIALEHSEWNAAWPVTSAEPVYGQTPEEVLLLSNTNTELHFPSKGYVVRKVLSVQSSDSSVTYDFSFNETTQKVTIQGATLPETRTPLLVRFIPVAPYSMRYLNDQEPVITLNEGTPPFELTQEKVVSSLESFVSQFNSLDDLWNVDTDFTWSDGRLEVTFTFDESSIYNSLRIEQTELRGSSNAPLSIACDDVGFVGLELDGYEDVYTIPDQSEDGFGSYDSPFHFDDTSSLFDDAEAVFDPKGSGEVSTELEDLREDAYAGVSDAALTGAPYAVYTEIEGYVFDNANGKFDDTSSTFDSYTTTDTPIDYTTPINYP